MESGVDTWVRDSGIPFMNLRGMFFAHFILLVFSMFGRWPPDAYLFYNGLFMVLLVWGIINKDKAEHLELAMTIDGASVMLDILVIASFFPESTSGKFSAVMAIFNLILRFASFLVIRNEVNSRSSGDGRLIGKYLLKKSQLLTSSQEPKPLLGKKKLEKRTKTGNMIRWSLSRY